MENYSYNSGDSSPRSREIEFENPPPWEDSQSNQPPPNYKVKFMCSYGGKIHPRPNDNQLSYMGGETKILAVDRNIRFVSLFSKLIAMCDSENISFKYQLPGEDLDALISVTNDDDMEHMMHEYERLYKASNKPARLRVFVFPTMNQSLDSSIRSFGSDDVRSEKERFVEALNSAPIMTTAPRTASPVAPQAQPPANNVDFLFGHEKANAIAAAQQLPTQKRVEDPVVVPGLDERFTGLDPIQKHIQDLQRLTLEKQQGTYRRKSDENLAGGGFTGGEYYKAPEKIPQVAVQGGVPYWTDNQVQGGGVYPAGSTVNNNEQPVYMVPHPPSGYHAPPPMIRPVAGGPTQGYYAVQRAPPEVHRDQQPQQLMYSNVIPQAPPPQMVAGYPEGYGMVRQGNTGGIGVVTEPGYAQMGYDGGAGRQVVYAAAGGVMAAPPAPMQTAVQYQQAMAGGVGVDMRQAGTLNPETGGKGVPKVTQNSV
ncbi:hypothetical protein CASFOL_035937 [Castilleja foliolosa]|uniref:PB1 domain-containing protein n=1 Tax=Castilleja foliolosa TaxID=1961234 RepID=A0ABD3BWF3_9LAMI